MRYLLLLFLLTTFYVQGLEVLDILGKNNEFFATSDADIFLAANSPYLKHFRWNTNEKFEARYPARKSTPRDLTFASMPIDEAIFKFKADKSLDSVTLSIFNRAYNTTMKIDEFEALIKVTATKLDALTNSSSTFQRGNLGKDSRLQSRIWLNKNISYILNSSYTDGKSKKYNQGEYITLNIQRYNPQEDPRRSSVNSANRKKIFDIATLKSNIVRQGNGTIYINNIPMVDQGDIGYCVPATIERVMRYFNIDKFDRYTIAQIAKSSPKYGTSIDQTLDSIDDVSSKLGIKVKHIYEFVEDGNAFKNFVEDYNKLAKKRDKEKVKIIIRDRVIYITETFDLMDKETFIELRNSKKHLKFFDSTVQEYINKGLPIGWSILSGVVSENNISATKISGHFRLIIGYNKARQKIIYTDTWGIGHEKKEMDLSDAAAITNHLIIFEPR